MRKDAIDQIRRFNRVVTQRIGALNDRYLARGRPLGEARLLWEIGSEGTSVRSLRKRLDLDSGYLSRLLRSLERDGMAAVEPDPADRRVRAVRLTDAGAEERATLDELSDGVARSFLEPLSESQRARLVKALGDAERLLTAGLVEIGVADPMDTDAQRCLNAYFEELHVRFEEGFDPARSSSPDVRELGPPTGLLLVAWLHGEPVGCGGLKFHGTEPAEIKRMWIDPSARGLGLGRRLLSELEEQVRRRGVAVVRLETNQALTEAMGLYRSSGYVEVEPYNDEAYAHHWFEKRLAP